MVHARRDDCTAVRGLAPALGSRDKAFPAPARGNRSAPSRRSGQVARHARGQFRHHTASGPGTRRRRSPRSSYLYAGMVADREVIPRAMKLNPALFETIYTGLLNSTKTRASVVAALEAVDRYLAARAPSLFAPVVVYLWREKPGKRVPARSRGPFQATFRRQPGDDGGASTWRIRDRSARCPSRRA